MELRKEKLNRETKGNERQILFFNFEFKKSNLDSGCAYVSCEPGSFCLHGTCQTAIGQNCTSKACQGGMVISLLINCTHPKIRLKTLFF